MEKVTMFTFKTLSQEHFQILFDWQRLPHVQQWWGEPQSWEAFCVRHQNMISDPLVFPHIVFLDEKPIGYINYWWVAEDEDFKPLYPANTVGTDQFIGVPELIGKGLGSEFVRIFTDQLLNRPDIALVITDPDVDNHSAIRCYEKVGFRKSRRLVTSEGEVQLLEKKPNQNAL